jgi:hypothetical protein
MKPTTGDLWNISALLFGKALNGELEAMSAEFRPLGDLLASLPLDERQKAFAAAMAARRDRDDIIRAMADVDPTQPMPPSEDDEADDDWGPIRLGMLPPVEPFPLDVLPLPAQNLATEAANAIGCPGDFLGLPMLAIAGGVIGRSVSLLLKPGYFVGPTLYGACVGPPSDGKTPALKIVASAVRAIDDELAAEHAADMAHWKLTQGGPKGKRAGDPPPKPRRIDIDDATMEVLPMLLEDNPRGLIMIRDELTSYLLGMNQYKGGKGNDRANALKIWSGDKIIKDRVNHENREPIRCHNPSAPVIGGIVPDMLGELTDPQGRADGFTDRFLGAYPDPMPLRDWSTKGIKTELVEAWKELVHRLWDRRMDDKDGRPSPHIAEFTPKARVEWIGRYNDHVAEMNSEDFDPSLRGPWGKFREYAGRLSLILALMRDAADPTLDRQTVPDIDAPAVRDAWRLVAYFKTHTRRILAAIAHFADRETNKAAKAIIQWALSKGLATFSERDIRRARSWIGPDDLREALHYLTECNVIREVPAPVQNAAGGRPPSPRYEINPLVNL